MNEFHQLFGFSDSRVGYAKTKQNLQIVDGKVQSIVNGKSFGIGKLEVISVAELRARLPEHSWVNVKNKFTHIYDGGDVRYHLRDKANSGAVFQVASQFNLLEMANSRLSPEDGVDIYWRDHTQGPACSTAAIGATVYRNYFLPVDGNIGQTRDAQVNCLAKVLHWISQREKFEWKFRNGYIFINKENFHIINRVLDGITNEEREMVKGLLEVGVHWDVEVNSGLQGLNQNVTQVFCSAFPLAYNQLHNIGEKLSSIILEAAQEATIITSILNKNRIGKGKVVFTKLGGGAFGNDHSWISNSISLAINKYSNYGLDIKLLHYGPSEKEYETIAVR